MVLTNVKVKNYLSINGECEFPVDPRVTVLLGANDHGKSNLLRSLEHLNFDKAISSEDVNWDTPGARLDFRFKLTEDEMEAINDLYTSISIELADFDAENDLDESADETSDAIASAIPGTIPIPPTAATPPTAPALATSATPAKPLQISASRSIEVLNREREVIEADIHLLKQVRDHLPEITFYREGFDGDLSLYGRSIQTMEGEIELAFAGMIPRVELFRAFSGELQDSVTEDQIKEVDSEFLQGIFFYAGLNPMDCENLFIQDDETDKTLEAASAQLDSALRERWAQGVDLDLHFQLKHRGASIELLVEDPAVRKRKARMSKRSSGVTQFFRLSMVLHARRMKNPSNSYIYVFDEPGVFLHPKGQKDLLSVFEQLAQDTQIIYATHSLFMLNQNFPERHRLITKSRTSTLVDSKPYRANWKYAVDALGVRLTANILFSPNILLVEGDSDPIYLYEILRLLNQANEIDADANLLGIMSYSDLPNLRFLLQTFKSESSERLLAILFDGDSQGKQYQKDIAPLAKRVDAKSILLDNNLAIEDYCVNPELFLKAVEETLRDSCEASDKKVPADLAKIIKTSWDEFQQNKLKSTPKDKRPLEALPEKESQVSETLAPNAGAWFKTLSIRLIDNGSSKVALARNYVFLSRENGTLIGVDPKRLQSAKSLAQNIANALSLPSQKAKKEIER